MLERIEALLDRNPFDQTLGETTEQVLRDMRGQSDNDSSSWHIYQIGSLMRSLQTLGYGAIYYRGDSWIDMPQPETRIVLGKSNVDDQLSKRFVGETR